MSKFVTQRVVLDITVRTNRASASTPDHWDFRTLLNVDGIDETLSVVSVKDIAPRGDHVQEMQGELWIG